MAVVITALLWATFGSHTPTHALDGPDANWKGDSITFDGHQYFAVEDEKSKKSLGLPESTSAFVYIPEATANAKTDKALVLYFSPGVDPPKATVISFASYTYTFATKEYSNPTSKKDVDITPKGEEASISSCSVSGIGWIICPVAVFLADAMDGIFDVVAGFMKVQPSTIGGPNDTLYIAWNIMRSLANVAFMIVFLIIIYSQLTNAGVSNYGLKKLLPRLVVAAVLVNLSFIISAIAVDLSNIIGFSVQDIFVNIRQDTFAITDDTWSANTATWTAITTAVLSGGAIGVAGITLAGDIAGAIYIILPILVGLILTILFVLLVLAARQAIIIILIVISPLAFVAFLLPNTEQWFKKWRELFMTMLIFFPAFSLAFGGSQLTGGLIIQSASSVFMIIFGLAVQVAPLIITPLILRFSGGVLGKIAGMFNDPRKGLLDRTKNWSKERQDMRRMGSLRTTNGRPNPFRRAAQFLDNNGQNVKNRTAQYTTENENRYHETDKYKKIHEDTFKANQDKELIENAHKKHIQDGINSRGSDLHRQNVRLEAAKAAVATANDETETQIEEYRSGRVAVTGELTNLVNSLRTSHEQVAFNAIRRKAAKDVVDDNWEKRYISDEHLQILSGGVGGIQAAERALASVRAEQSKAHSENVSAARALADAFKLTVEQRNDLAKGKAVRGVDSNGIGRDFTAANAFTREVAIVDTIKAAPYGMGAEIIMKSGDADFAEFRGAIAEAMETGNWEGKGAYYDGETRDALKQGIVDRDYLKKRAAEFLVNGKLSAELMATNHKNSLSMFIEAADDLRKGKITLTDDKFAAGNLGPGGVGDVNVALARVKTSATTAIEDPRIEPRLGDRKDAIQDISNKF